MRPYYTGNAKERLARLTPEDHRRVLAWARQQAYDNASSGDIQRELYAVMPRHLDECGFNQRRRKKKVPVLSRYRVMLDAVSACVALPHQFRESEGGGWSFLQACVDEDGEQWGEHVNMEQLFCLGMGLKLVSCLLPRDMWFMLPGSMPYYLVLDKKP